MERVLYKQLNKVINILILFFSVITVPGMLLSLSRIPQIGFRPEMYFHIILSFAVIFMAVFRRKIPYRVKAAIAVASFMVIGYSGLFSIGLSSSGRLDMVISIALACLFFNLRTGIILGAVNTVVFIAIAYLNIKGLINFNIDFNIYNFAPKSWAAAFYNFTAMGVLMVLATGLVNQQQRKNLQKIFRKKNQLHKEITQRKLAEERYRKLSILDPLTNLYNRRYFFEKADEEIIRSERYNRHLSIIMVDADHFKNINDTYGHHAGDFILKEIAVRFRQTLRPSDIASRFGGEEFCLILPETDINEAQQVAERLRQAVSSKPFVHLELPIELTCSFGIAEKRPEDKDISGIVIRADNALYEAKTKGRNTISVSA